MNRHTEVLRAFFENNTFKFRGRELFSQFVKHVGSHNLNFIRRIKISIKIKVDPMRPLSHDQANRRTPRTSPTCAKVEEEWDRCNREWDEACQKVFESANLKTWDIAIEDIRVDSWEPKKHPKAAKLQAVLEVVQPFHGRTVPEDSDWVFRIPSRSAESTYVHTIRSKLRQNANPFKILWYNGEEIV